MSIFSVLFPLAGNHCIFEHQFGNKRSQLEWKAIIYIPRGHLWKLLNQAWESDLTQMYGEKLNSYTLLLGNYTSACRQMTNDVIGIESPFLLEYVGYSVKIKNCISFCYILLDFQRWYSPLVLKFINKSRGSEIVAMVYEFFIVQLLTNVSLSDFDQWNITLDLISDISKYLKTYCTIRIEISGNFFTGRRELNKTDNLLHSGEKHGGGHQL